MNIDQIRDKIVGREISAVGLRHLFSVLIPIIDIDEEPHVVFEKRAKTLRNQPNEVSFPGGKIEPGETPEEAAFRETIEELVIDPKHLEIIQELDYLVTRDSNAIHSFVGYIKDIEMGEIKGNPGEVAYLFTVPLQYFLENEPLQYTLEFTSVESEDFPYEWIQNGKDYNFTKVRDTVYFYIYEERIIWGFTAKMMRSFVETLKEM
ncbi:CoA pyrophosphatase [Peptoniphilus sp. KCTC 25270]|uniref:NUDIX hydrolase n=1 Tax=Peptoniphilus sp. KCTC 25270 TaxID=2897414 RepID=UPI001E38A35D|nr:CoA pyrophosphatase [Peptoniphilus sp. KCTC 25270]MCD1147642.1 CoA pyrophosphatase [Peptoniphilus sp. KCTC 25270]